MTIEESKKLARRLQVETYAIYLAYRHPRTPWYARLPAILVIGYVISPIDLIPDFIPVLGQLDDLIVVTVGVALTLRLMPRDVRAECRTRAQETFGGGIPSRSKWLAVVVIIAAWCLLAALVAAVVLLALR